MPIMAMEITSREYLISPTVANTINFQSSLARLAFIMNSLTSGE